MLCLCSVSNLNQATHNHTSQFRLRVEPKLLSCLLSHKSLELLPASSLRQGVGKDNTTFEPLVTRKTFGNVSLHIRLCQILPLLDNDVCPWEFTASCFGGDSNDACKR